MEDFLMNNESIINILALTFFFVLIIVTISFYFKSFPKKDFNIVRFISRVAIFGAMATILYVVPYFKIKIPIFPSFLEFHFDEIPAFICGFAYGPLSGFCVLLIKTLLKLPTSITFTVGEFSDLLLSTIYVVTASFIYSKKRNLKGVLWGFLIGTVVQIVSAMFFNVYLLIPFYCKVMGYKPEDLLFFMRQAIPAIKDIKWSYSTLAVLPFNAIKDVLVVIVTFIVYRSIHYFLRFDGRVGTKKKK